MVKRTQWQCGKFSKIGTNQRLESLYVSYKDSSIPSRCMTMTAIWRNISRGSSDSNSKSKNKENKSPNQATSAYSSTAHQADTTPRLASWKHRTTQRLPSLLIGYSKNIANSWHRKRKSP